MPNTIWTAGEFFFEGCGTVTLCGSTQFFFDAMEANRELTFQNWIVLMCGSWGHSFHKYDSSEKERDFATVKKLHFFKILKSDAVVVVSDTGGYMGDSTKCEIAFAESMNIPVFNFYGGKWYGTTTKQPPLIRDLNQTDYINSFLREYGGNTGL